MAAPCAPRAQAQTSPAIYVVLGVDRDGRSSAKWREMIHDRLSAAEFDSVEALVHPLTPGEEAWVTLIESRQSDWTRQIASLVAPFEPSSPPNAALVVLGNRGGSDAFAADASTIGFDLSELSASYGAAGELKNTDLIDRLFRHVYTHLMQKAWFRAHPWRADTPLQRAIVDIWLEGQGNYYSLSAQWRSNNGVRSELAASALSTLEPRFVARVAALACARTEAEPSLRTGLSSGRFDQKWGALPVALWLEDERARSLDALQTLVRAGPLGIWDLATRHLPEPLARALNEARAQELACDSTGR